MQHFMTLRRHTVTKNDLVNLGDGQHAIRVLQGNVIIGDRTIAAGEGTYAGVGSTLSGDAEILQFTISGQKHEGANLMSQEIDGFATAAILRLDQITFPPGAIAYRHIHAGAGIRCLISGELTIRADDHVEIMPPFKPWFEAANSPVRAEASLTHETTFVRAMLLPVEYAGKPTITYLNTEDDDKPRLQSNHRFFDQLLDFENLQ